MPKKTEKVRAFLPIFAEGLFTCDKPGNWDDMDHTEREVYFLNCCGSISSVCHQCGNILQTDFEVDLEACETLVFSDTN